MKRVLILIKGLGRGGAEYLVLSAMRHRDPDRFRYRVAYLLPWKDALVPDLAAMGVPAVCLDGARGPGWIRRLRSLLRDQRIEIVHAHSPYPAVGARLVAARRTRLVYTEHNVWQRYHRATYWANAVTYPRNDLVFAVSDEVRRSIRYPGPLSLLRMPSVETLYHGVEPALLEDAASPDGVREELGIPPDALVVGTVANLKPHKGLQHLLKAAVLVRRKVPAARFLVVGQGEARKDLEALASELGLDDAVTFTGFREDAVRIASAFDVFAMSSLHEGLSIAMIEAMALGKPVVVTRVGGLPEVVEDGKDGILVPPSDPRAMAARIIEVLGDPALRERLGRAARRRAEAFDVRASVRRSEDAYEELTR
jgi:glycosyltransferase involved in cell wall biosynthesis